MGFFGKKTAAPAPVATPTTASALVENPRTLVLSFLHETSKSTGMREYVKNYAFHLAPDGRFVVVVDLKDSSLRAEPAVLWARWQLLQLSVMRWAQSKELGLASLACALPLDKASPLAQLKVQAQLAGEAQVDEAELGSKNLAKSPSSIGKHHAVTPESQIEVHDDDMAAAEEFFRLTQVPSQS